jgi:hypothetical protein
MPSHPFPILDAPPPEKLVLIPKDPVCSHLSFAAAQKTPELMPAAFHMQILVADRY